MFAICAIASIPSPAAFLSVQCVFTSSTAQAAFKDNSVPKQVPILLFFVGSYVVTMCRGGPHQQLNDHATLNNYSDS